MEEVGPKYYDRQGGPIDRATLLRLKGDEEYLFRAREVVGEVEVVTAWLGIDQDYADEQDHPLIFGTVGLLRDHEGKLFEDVELFAGTETVALGNHPQMLDRVRTSTAP